jgi:hypothetical protein
MIRSPWLRTNNMDNRENRPFACEICEVRFTTRQFLQRHYIVHTEERNYKCILCNNSYKYKKGLNRHYKKAHTTHYNSSVASKHRQKHRIPYESTQSVCVNPKISAPSPQVNDRSSLPSSFDISKMIITSPFPVSWT